MDIPAAIWTETLKGLNEAVENGDEEVKGTNVYFEGEVSWFLFSCLREITETHTGLIEGHLLKERSKNSSTASRNFQ